MTRDPRHRIGLHHSNHLIDVMDTWPATRRRRFPFGLRRDPFRGWVVSEAIVERGELKELAARETAMAIKLRDGGRLTDQEDREMLREFHDDLFVLCADWKATQYAEYRIKRGYVSPLSKEEKEGSER